GASCVSLVFPPTCRRHREQYREVGDKGSEQNAQCVGRAPSAGDGEPCVSTGCAGADRELKIPHSSWTTCPEWRTTLLRGPGFAFMADDSPSVCPQQGKDWAARLMRGSS